MSAPAPAFTPPPLEQEVTDTAHVLQPDELDFLNARLHTFRQQTGYAIVVLVTDSLHGESIDDAAYEVFKAWKPGEKGKDNGVLLMIAPQERKIRIETGKGVEGQLTDLQSNDIIRQQIGPRLKLNRFRDGILAGTDAIAHALAPNAELPVSRVAPVPVQMAPDPHIPSSGQPLGVGCVALLFILVCVFIVLRSFFRGGGGGWGGGGFGDGGFGGGGFGGGGFGGGGDSGGGYSGGGGESGGGGSSDSY